MTSLERLEAERDQIIRNGGTPGPELYNKIDLIIRLENPPKYEYWNLKR